MTAVTVIHREFRFDMPAENGTYRCVGLLPDGQVGVFVQPEGAASGTLEFAFPLNEAQFCAERILAGDMGAARRPGMSRMLAAAVMVLVKAGLAGGVLTETPHPEDGPEDRQ